ncbi:MAG: NAD(P)-dependent oxidoreductase [Gracilibacteraceae bacterium]|jgi:predicted homoserine dehydrogenase-like protein|nr:NAD(P)-dependent oxidoreductase [Gracilibacteraceae bacterium]
MLGINYRLESLEAEGKRIKAGIIGAGQMGRGMVSQMMLMKGIVPVVVVDIIAENAIKAYKNAGLSDEDYKVVNTAAEADAWIEKGKYIISENAEVATKSNLVDVVVDATGMPESGAKISVDAVTNKKHLVMLSVETDIVIGPLLKKLADNAGVIYTGSAGDEPGAVKELYDFASSLGFDVKVVGKGKNNTLDLECNPDTVLEEATRRGVSPKMLTSFKDGTKTMVELTAMSNATGFLPDVRGAHGAAGSVNELPQILSLKEEGGILNSYGVVEYINGVAPGVFVIIGSKLPEVRRELEYLSMGKGPNYVLYRPYHLCSLETPLSVVKAVLDSQSTIVPLNAPISETIAIAKKDMKAGQYLDGIGGYTVYGTIEKADVAKSIKALPVGLVNKKTRLLTDVKKGEIITYDMAALDGDSLIVQLRRIQDKFF